MTKKEINKKIKIEKKLVESIQTLEKNDEQLHKEFKKIIATLEATGLKEFMKHLQSPWRIIWSNFIAGLFRGLGIILGMTVILGMILWFMGQFVDLPIIGKFFQDSLDLIKQTQQQKAY